MDSNIDTGYFLAILVGGLIFWITNQQLKTYSFWSLKGVKGPTPWPFVGTSIYYLFRNRIEVDHEWSEKYGRIYGIYEGSSPVLRTTDADLIKHVWIKDFPSITDRNKKFIFGDHLKRWLFWSSGDHWSNQRVLITPVFTSSKMKVMFNTMSTCVSRFMAEVSSKLAGSEDFVKGKEGERKDKIFSKDDFMSLTLDVIAQAFFSLKIDTYKDKTSEFFKRAFAFASFDVPRFMLWLCVPSSISKLLKFDITGYGQYEYFDKLSQSVIDERRKNVNFRKSDIVQALLDAKLPETSEHVFTKEDDLEAHYNAQLDHKELEDIHVQQRKQVTFKEFEDIEIRAHMVFFFLAGFETTSSTLSFCFYALAHNPEIQEEIYEELKLRPDITTQLDYSELLSMKKLDAFVSETMRLYSPVTEHNRMITAKEGVVLPTEPPISLPVGCVVSVPGFELQRDPEYWPEPLTFDITRFYSENKGKIKSGSYVPFGIGPRNCAGMRFALLQIKLLVARVLLKYKIVSGPNSQECPPKFNKHAFFLQLKNSDFKLLKRQV